MGGVRLDIIIFLICFPFFAAAILAFMKKSGKVRKYTLFAFCAIIVVGVLYFVLCFPLATLARRMEEKNKNAYSVG